MIPYPYLNHPNTPDPPVPAIKSLLEYNVAPPPVVFTSSLSPTNIEYLTFSPPLPSQKIILVFPTVPTDAFAIRYPSTPTTVDQAPLLVFRVV